MKFFYMSSLPNSEGQFTVHDRDCFDIPSIYERDYLGPFNTALEALRYASTKEISVITCMKCWSKNEIYSVKSEIVEK